MKNCKYLVLVITFIAVFAGCKKEELPPAACFSYGGSVIFSAPLSTPVDSIAISVTSASGDTRPRRYVYYAITSSFQFSTEACGPYKYKMEIFNPHPNPEINVTMYTDSYLFFEETFTGSKTFEGTYEYELH